MSSDDQAEAERSQETRVGTPVVDPGSLPPPQESPLEAQQRGEAAAHEDPFNDKPHLFVAGAFAGGFLFAQLLKHLGGGDD
jgi:hypothetical protein